MGRGRRAGSGLHTAALAVAVVALLAVVAAASRAGAVAFGGASDQVRGTVEVAWPFVLVAAGAAFVTALLGHGRLWRWMPQGRTRPALRAETALVVLIVVAVLSLGAMFFVAAHNGSHLKRLLHRQAAVPAQRHARAPTAKQAQRRFQLPEWALPALLATGASGGAALVARRRRRRAVPDDDAREELTAGLDAALADLEGNADVRAAIVALYRRMLHAFAVLGFERDAAEAPREYLTRALAGLQVPEAPAMRLTGLFEEARFSEHELGAERRDEAASALAAVRAELVAGAPS
jgi:hypothetical protein